MRALIYLASNRSRGSIFAKEIAEKAKIPKNYLSKLLYELKRAGFLEANRGKTGGYRLAIEPDKVTLADIVTRFDGSDAYEGCFLKSTKCNEINPCAAHNRWRPIANQITSFMEKTTLAELAV